METSELAKQYDKIQVGHFCFASTPIGFHAQYAKSCAEVAKANEGKALVIFLQVDSAFVTEIEVPQFADSKILRAGKQSIVMHSHITYFKSVEADKYELQPGEKFLSVGSNLKTVK